MNPVMFVFVTIILCFSYCSKSNACDDKGKVETKRYDSLGNYTVKDNRGNTTTCRVDSLKNVTCKTK